MSFTFNSNVQIINDTSHPVPVTGNTNVSVTSGNVSIDFQDGPATSAFSRLRIAPTALLGEFRNRYGTTGNLEIISRTVGSATIATNLTSAYTTLTVTSATGDTAIRQSRQYHPYIPGTSQIGMITFAFSAGQSGIVQAAGMFDDNDGILFRMNGTTPQFVIRKGGTDVEVIDQTSWNVDTMNGNSATSPSGIILDFTKAQILVIDYQWLGVGRVRVGFDIDGNIVYSHYFNHANSVTEPYTQQASLPVRWEIKNTTGVAGPVSMRAICFSVYAEGVNYETGFINSASNDTTAVTVGGPAVGILAVRLKNTVNTIPVKALARLKQWSILTNNDIHYKVYIMQDSSAISGTPTWTSATPTGWCEYTTNFSLVTDPPTNAVVLSSGYANGNQGNSGGPSFGSGIGDRSATIYQNFDSTNSMIFAIIGYKLAQNASVYASMNWIEIK